MKDKRWTVAHTLVSATLIGLAAVTTMVIRVPIPATGGYFNIGDIFVSFAGLWLGPMGGALVGGIGPAIADAIGFPVYVPATAMTKGLEGLLVGLIARNAGNRIGPRVFAVFVGGLTVVVGYFAFQAYIYPFLGQTIPAFAITSVGAAVIEVIPNAVQGVVGAVGGLALWKAVAGFGTLEKDDMTAKG